MAEYYNKQINGVKVDPYRIATLYEICHPAQFHALKKILRAGEGAKSLLQDIDETIQTLERWKEMIDEDETLPCLESQPPEMEITDTTIPT